MEELEKSIKTGLSLGITILIGNLLNIDSLFFAGIAAVICSQVKNIESIKVGIGRLYGTFIGASFGILFYEFFPANTLVLALGCTLIVFITQKFLKMSQSNIACVVFLAIMLNLEGKKDADYYALHRIFDTSLGVIVSIIVSHIKIFKHIYK